MLSASSPQSIWALSWSATFLGLILLGLLKLAFPSKLKLPPGPKGWPIIGSMVELARIGDPRTYRTFEILAKKYGPIMHLKMGGFDAIVISSAKLSEELFKTRDLEFSSRPHDTMIRSAAKYIGFGEDMGLLPLSSKVKLLKKISKSEFSTTAKLDATVEMRSEEVARMIRNLSPIAQNTQNKKLPRQHFVEMTANVMCRLLVGDRPYGNNLSDENLILKKYKEIKDEFSELTGRVNLCDLFPILDWVDPQGMHSRFKMLSTRVKEILGIIIDEHRARRANYEVNDKNAKDFVNVMLDYEGEENENFSDITIMGVVNDLMLGGIDTSASAVEWALGELLAKPHLMTRLQSDVDNVVGSQRRVAESDVCNMPFLNAVIQETHRLHPLAPLLFPHKNEAQCTLADYDIPANASLFVNTWAIGRDPSVWENPTDYNPDRFLPGGANSKVKMNGSFYELLPFGTGRRMCVGMNLGMVLVQISLATIVHAFDWSLPVEKNGEVDFDDVYTIVSMMKNPLVTIPRARDALKNYL